eukprot:819940-Prymnesium_polylepis.1
MDLTAHLDAAYLGAPSPPPRETPLPRIPPKKAPAVSKKTAVEHLKSPIRAMALNHLRDVTNNVDLGMVLKSKQVSKQKLRITTTLLTLEVDGKRIVRGRLNKKALYGATVEHISHPFA